jgi:hypothetical protein
MSVVPAILEVEIGESNSEDNSIDKKQETLSEK